MHIILGASGHVGRAVAENLIERNEPVTVVTHDAAKAAAWKERGAGVAVADVAQTVSLVKAFRGGKRLFLLNPPAPPASDAPKVEAQSVGAILRAIRESSFEQIVAESTYGAQPGDDIGDLGVLWKMEEGLRALNIPHRIIRAAYYMSNWDPFLEMARATGKIQSLYPADFAIPMVAPADIGAFAARLLAEPIGKSVMHEIEGPREYTSADVARAFAHGLRHPVEVETIPAREWVPHLMKLGFSGASAQAMARMTKVTMDANYDRSKHPHRGTTSIDDYVADLVSKTAAPSQDGEAARPV